MPQPERHGNLAVVDRENALASDVAPMSTTSIPELFSALESAKQELGIEYYSVSRATLDQVFLNIVNKHNVSEEDGESPSKKPKGAKRGRRLWFR